MPALPSRSPVTDVPASRPADAQQHFARLLELETDCWDVHASLQAATITVDTSDRGYYYNYDCRQCR